MWNPFARPHPATTDGGTGSRPAHGLHAAGSSADPSDDGVRPLRTASAPAPKPSTPPPALRKGSGGRIAEVEVIGQIAVATFTETELCQDSGSERLAELLVELAETGALHFVLDVQNVQFMDSACLGCLVEALNRLAVRGGRIALVNPNHSVHYVFKLTRLDRVFVICHDVPHALQAVERAQSK